MVLGWCSFRFEKIMTPGPKMVPPGGLSVFHRTILKNKFALKILGQFLQYFTGMVLGWFSFRFFSNFDPWAKNDSLLGLSVFGRKILKNLLLRNYWANFLLDFTGTFLGWSSFRFLEIITPGPKMAEPGGLSVFCRKII